jgi:hypothetical protein
MHQCAVRSSARHLLLRPASPSCHVSRWLLPGARNSLVSSWWYELGGELIVVFMTVLNSFFLKWRVGSNRGCANVICPSLCSLCKHTCESSDVTQWKRKCGGWPLETCLSCEGYEVFEVLWYRSNMILGRVRVCDYCCLLCYLIGDETCSRVTINECK